MARDRYYKRNTPLTPVTITAADCSCEVKRGIIASLPFLQGLAAADVDAIEPLFRDRAFASGQLIDLTAAKSWESDSAAAESLYIVGAGLIKLVRRSPDGREIVLDIMVTGETFGLAAAKEDFAVSHTNSCVFEVNAAGLEQLFARHPGTAAALLRENASRINALHHRLQLLAVAPARVRVIAALLRLGEKVGVPRRASRNSGQELLLQMPLTREDLAAFSGTTTETASRVISSLEREGSISSGRRWYAILNYAALEHEIHALD